MEKAIIGKKLGMSQIFGKDGRVIPVTVVKAGPCVVVQKKTEQNDGYIAVQMGFEDLKPKAVNKPQEGHFKKAGAAPKRHLREFKLSGADKYNLGDIVKADVFANGDTVDVCGVSKGKGFAGAIKRHGSHSLKASHGTGPVARQAGSMGASSTPSRIMKGKKMAGHMGHERSTVQNLTVAKVDAENNLIAVKGAVPGPRFGIVTIVDSVKKGKGGNKDA